jgi:triosephosphate isomerase
LRQAGAIAIAYEPIWAIGSGISASSEQAVAMHKVIRETVREVAPAQADEVRILYGGSVNAENAAGLFEHPEIEGVLVGGASLDKAQFAAIIRAASAAAS